MSDHFRDYFNAPEPENPEAANPGEGRVLAPTEHFIDDYFGSPNTHPMPVEMPDATPWTIATAEETARGDVSGVDVIAPVEDQTQNTADSGLVYPPHRPPGPNEIGYGAYGAEAPFIASPEMVREQRLVLSLAERIVAESRALLVQTKVADGAHFETWPYANGATLVAATNQVGYKHPNQLGYLILASAAGLYVGEDQNAGIGNMGIPVPTGTTWMTIPANCNLFISTAGMALSQATSLYLITLRMGTTTL